MHSINPIEYLEKNRENIHIEYNRTTNNPITRFPDFMEELISTARVFLKNKANTEAVCEQLEKHLLFYTVNNQRIIRYWLFKAFDKEILHYHIVKCLIEKDQGDIRNNIHPKYFRRNSFNSFLIHERNEEIFKKKYGLSNCEFYVEKRKFLESCADYYLEKYSLLLNNYSANVSDEGLTDKQFYDELYQVTIKELEMLDKKEKTRLFEESNHAYFIDEDIIGQVHNILAKEHLIHREDERALWQLLRFGSSLSRKIKVKLSAASLTHTFYQLAEQKLIQKSSTKELTEWLFSSFEPKRRGENSAPLAPDTLRRYISKRKNASEGLEIFKVVKIKSTKNGPQYTLERINE
jgi:hypothetical protein